MVAAVAHARRRGCGFRGLERARRAVHAVSAGGGAGEPAACKDARANAARPVARAGAVVGLPELSKGFRHTATVADDRVGAGEEEIRASGGGGGTGEAVFCNSAFIWVAKTQRSAGVPALRRGLPGLEGSGRPLLPRAWRLQRIPQATFLGSRQMPRSWVAERAEAKHGCQCCYGDCVFQARGRRRFRGAQAGSLRGVCQKGLAGVSLSMLSLESFPSRRRWRACCREGGSGRRCS